MQMETDKGYDSAFAEIQDIDTEMHIPSNALMLWDYYLFFSSYNITKLIQSDISFICIAKYQ